MNRFFLCLIVTLLIIFSAVFRAQAIPFSLTENGSGLIPDNVWHGGEVYTFTGDSINLDAGQYELKYSLSGKVWATNPNFHGWEYKDKIIIEAFLNDTLIESKAVGGLDGQHQFFEFSLDLDFDINMENDSFLDIYAYSSVSDPSEVWQSNSSFLAGTFAEFGGQNSPSPTPEPASILLLSTGVISLAGFGRKKFFKK